MTNTKLPILQTARSSWRDGWRAACAMPKFAAIALVLLLVELILNEILAPNEFEEPLLWRQLLRIALAVPSAFFVTPLLIAFYRYLLLGEVSQRYTLDLSSPRFRAYFGYSAAVGLILTANILTDPAGPVVTLIGFGMNLAVLLFTAMLFPAIAVDAPAANVTNATRDLKLLQALTIGVVTWLPLAIASSIIYFLLFWDSEILRSSGGERIAEVATTSVFGFVLEMTGLGFTAHFYRAWAQRLGRPAGILE